MKNIEIRYYSQSGNTQKLAGAIGQVLNIPAYTIDRSINSDVDILFLGGALYAYGISNEMKSFIQSLDPDKIGKVVLFTNSALSKSVTDKMRKELEAKGIQVDANSFYCKGSFKFMNRNHPDQSDLDAIKVFAQNCVKD